MTDSNDAKKVERDSIKIAVDNVANLSEKIKLGQNIAAISILSGTLSSFQSAVNASNISGFIATSNAFCASFFFFFPYFTTPSASLSSSIQID